MTYDQLVVPFGALLGRVGNTGNTREPHLHVHGRRPSTADGELALVTGARLMARSAARIASR